MTSFTSDRNIIYFVGAFPAVSETFVINEIIEGMRQGLSIEVFSTASRKQASSIHDFAKILIEKTNYLPEDLLCVTFITALFLLLHPLISFSIIYKSMSLPILPGHSKIKRTVKALYFASLLYGRKNLHLHGHWTNPSDVVHVLGNSLSLPFSFTVHAHDIYDEDPILEQMGGGIAKRSEGASFIATCTIHNQNHLIAHYGKRLKSPLYAIHHGVNTAFFTPNNTKLENTIPTILSVGRIIPYKGYDRLINILDTLHSEGILFNAVAIGDGSLRNDLLNQIQRRQLQGIINLPGALPAEKVKEYFTASDIFVLIGSAAKGQYGLPNVIVEAMCSGLAVITTDLPAVHEIIINGENGLIVQDSDDEILQSIKYLIENRDARSSMGQKARETVLASFALDNNTRKLCNLFNQSSTDS